MVVSKGRLDKLTSSEANVETSIRKANAEEVTTSWRYQIFVRHCNDYSEHKGEVKYSRVILHNIKMQ